MFSVPGVLQCQLSRDLEVSRLVGHLTVSIRSRSSYALKGRQCTSDGPSRLAFQRRSKKCPPCLWDTQTLRSLLTGSVKGTVGNYFWRLLVSASCSASSRRIFASVRLLFLHRCSAVASFSDCRMGAPPENWDVNKSFSLSLLELRLRARSV